MTQRIRSCVGALGLCALLLSSTAIAKPTKRAAKPAAAAASPKADAPAPAKADAAPSSSAGDGEDAGRRGPSRIEFDDRLVQGQTNKANAIYLFERRESALRSLLKKRTNFHDEIDEMLEDELVR
jgi:hypothetical protein